MTVTIAPVPCGRELRNMFGHLLKPCGYVYPSWSGAPPERVQRCHLCTSLGDRLASALYDHLEFSDSWAATLAANLMLASALGRAKEMP